jgi:hypothetical protein
MTSAGLMPLLEQRIRSAVRSHDAEEVQVCGARMLPRRMIAMQKIPVENELAICIASNHLKDSGCELS